MHKYVAIAHQNTFEYGLDIADPELYDLYNFLEELYKNIPK